MRMHGSLRMSYENAFNLFGKNTREETVLLNAQVMSLFTTITPIPNGAVCSKG
jgi:hypothetical protein